MSLTPSSPHRTFQNRVSFDTFDNRDASDFSLTLNSKHKEYKYTKRSRTFLCGTDQNDYSEFALEWLIDELVDDGDEIVCLRVVDKDSKINSDASLEVGRYRTEAKKLLDQVIAKNNDDDKAISLVLEFAVGKVQETIQRMVGVSCATSGSRLARRANSSRHLIRLRSTNRSCLLSGHAAVVWVASRVSCPVLCPSIASSIHQYL